MDNIWEVAEKFPDEFIAVEKEYGRISAQLLWNRGIKSLEAIKEFFGIGLEDALHDPFLFRDMEKAVGIAIEHIKKGNKIVVYGDYDADGVTASALLVETLNILRADADVYIPHRVIEGYGLNPEAIKTIAEMGAKLIITVDGGIRNKKEVESALAAGIEVIITDHHPAPLGKEELPACPVINPVVDGETYPYRKLAGVGVAFKFASALIERSKLGEEDKKKLKSRLFDLVAIGTVADIVELLGENRTMVKAGLELINDSPRTGLAELLTAAGLKNGREIDSWNIGFQIAPRLNAAGRMGRANAAYDLLVSRSLIEARELAEQLNARNIERQKQTENITAEIDARIDLTDGKKIIIGICSEGCADSEEADMSQGVIGLVAGKLQNKYRLPSLVITKDKNGYKGSGRSVAGFNLAAAVESCRDLLVKYGGHPMACGFSVSADNLEVFRKKMEAIAKQSLSGADLSPRLAIDAEIRLDEINEDLLNDLARFSPFGQGNPRPQFSTKGLSILDKSEMGADGQHVKFRLGKEGNRSFFALAFNQAEKLRDFLVGDQVDAAYYPEKNEFNGRREIQLKLADMKKA